MELLASTIMARTIEASDVAKALRITAVAHALNSERDTAADVTPERLLEILIKVNGNRTEAARIIWPQYRLDEIKNWKRKDVDRLVREFGAADPMFAQRLPEAYHQTSLGGRPRRATTKTGVKSSL
jgi:hypothetical protein